MTTAKNFTWWAKQKLDERLLKAAVAGDELLVKSLLALGADPNACDIGGRTPLHSAGLSGSVEVVRALLAAGAAPGVADQYGKTPIHEASHHGHVEIIQALLAAGADLEKADEDGWTVLHWAVLNGNAEAVEALLSAGADPDAEDKYGDLPEDVAEGTVKNLFARRLALSEERALLDCLPPGKAQARSSAL